MDMMLTAVRQMWTRISYDSELVDSLNQISEDNGKWEIFVIIHHHQTSLDSESRFYEWKILKFHFSYYMWWWRNYVIRLTEEE